MFEALENAAITMVDAAGTAVDVAVGSRSVELALTGAVGALVWLGGGYALFQGLEPHLSSLRTLLAI